MKRIGVALLAVAFSASAGCARRVATTFKDLESRVRPGAVLYVTSHGGQETKGSLDAVSGSSLKLRIRDTAARDFAEADVSRIRERDSLWNGLLIGAATGGLMFAAVGEEGCTAPNAVAGCRKVSRGAGTAAMAAIGAGIGVGVDALHRRRVFRGAPRRGATLTIMPALSRQGSAVMLTSRF